MGNAFPIPNPIDCLVQLLEDPEFLDIILDDDDLEDDLQPVREDLRDFRRKQFSNRRAAPRQRDRAYALREMSQLSDNSSLACWRIIPRYLLRFRGFNRFILSK